MKTSFALTTFIFSLALAAPHKRQQNLQTFTGALGGIAATPVTDSGNADRPFQVKGDTFVGIGAALQRSCDQQFNACANAANGGDATLSVSACNDQKTQCDAADQGAAANQAAAGGNGNANQNANQNGNANQNANGNASAASGCGGAKRRSVQPKKN